MPTCVAIGTKTKSNDMNELEWVLEVIISQCHYLANGAPGCENVCCFTRNQGHYTVSQKKHVTTLSTITLTIRVRLQ